MFMELRKNGFWESDPDSRIDIVGVRSLTFILIETIQARFLGRD